MTGFILFDGRLLNAAHIITITPPRPDGGKHVIETRVVGGSAYVEEHEDAEDAAGRYLSLASLLLQDPSIAAGVRPTLAPVTELPSS